VTTVPLRFVVLVVGSAAYLALAVLGWGGFGAFFSRPALVALAVVFAALVGVAFFAGGNLSQGKREDRGNRWVLFAAGVIRLLDAFCRLGRTAEASGPSMAMRSAGSTCCCLPSAAYCGCGRFSCWASGSAGWLKSSRTTR
jgi:hypothetical protein